MYVCIFLLKYKICLYILIYVASILYYVAYRL
uniref:Uncharacterized protein n=1 Tax=Anguilla anguilla TaxID=7936 RepID=A0A0E9SYP8_ANGAN